MANLISFYDEMIGFSKNTPVMIIYLNFNTDFNMGSFSNPIKT